MLANNPPIFSSKTGRIFSKISTNNKEDEYGVQEVDRPVFYANS